MEAHRSSSPPAEVRSSRGSKHPPRGSTERARRERREGERREIKEEGKREKGNRSHLHLSSDSWREVGIVVMLQPGMLENLSDLLGAEEDGSVVNGVDVVRENGEVGLESDGVDLSLLFTKDKRATVSEPLSDFVFEIREVY